MNDSWCVFNPLLSPEAFTWNSMRFLFLTFRLNFLHIVHYNDPKCRLIVAFVTEITDFSLSTEHHS